jgi:N6-adenosine-specific RNA methylase IME4
VLLADPPWKFGDALPGKGRGAAKHYPCMTLDELCAFELPPLAADCMLLLWRVASMQREALAVIDAWGFTLKSEVVWLKTSSKQRRIHFGMGRYVRASHEVCLLAVRGRVRVADHSVRSVFAAPVQEHSRKPSHMHRIAERLVPGGPYVELFARARRANWMCLGNQVCADPCAPCAPCATPGSTV